MSGISGLFADSKKDSSISNLFATSNAIPLNKSIKERTVIKTKSQPVEETDEVSEEEPVSEKEPAKEQKPTKKRKRADDDNEDLEGKYLEKLLDEKNEEEEEEKKKDQDEESDSDSDPESEEEQEEEKDSNDAKSSKASAARKLDFKNEEIEKAERTIFVGNLSSNVITSKTDYKSFKKFFQKNGDIASIRFRSIAFKEALPRKVAFVKQKLHSSRDSINSYIVFKTKEGAREALKSNGSVFLDLHLRVDSISHPAKIDNKRAIFVGNLDFEEKEEELWNIFGELGEIEFVRIVRDAKTNVGKGFGYVQFKDFTSVSKALLLHDKKLGEKKRKLRISRSKKINKPREQLNTSAPNSKKQRSLDNLNEDQKTKLGRARRVLGKADRATAGQQIVEGMRAKKGDAAVGIKSGKNRVKKPRIRQRSTDFKKARHAVSGK